MAPAPQYGTVSPYLSVAIRAYTEPDKSGKRGGASTVWPRAVLVFDCETSADETQRLLFGSYRYLRVADTKDAKLRCAEEGLFYAPDLDAAARQTLNEYVRANRAEVYGGVDPTLHLRPLDEFLERVLWRGCWQHPAQETQPAALVGFNLPFDLSRLARTVGKARGPRRKDEQRRGGFVGGFSFGLYGYQTANGQRQESQYRPRVVIKTIDSKRHLTAFIPPAEIDQPELFDSGFRGHFLDLRTLAFSLSDRGYSLARACEDWNVEEGKTEADEHGLVTPKYIDYNRQDVKATAGLYEKLTEEYRTHPIALQPSKAYSPASIGKAYLRSMQIEPALARQDDFPAEVLGWSMSAYYGGRAECRIRRTAVPVAYLDFLSMYPTVNSLLGLWDLVTCERVEVEDATEEVRRLFGELTLDGCFDQSLWRQFAGLVEIEPDSDILPVRGRYAHSPTPSWQIGVNPLTSRRPLWFAIPDAVSATLLTGRPPRVRRAIKLVPHGRLAGLQGAKLAGTVPIDPTREDFFREVIQQRKSLDARGLNPSDRSRLDRFLKVVANAASYGIYAEMVRHELPGTQTAPVRVRALDSEPFMADTTVPEEPGEFCFPPMAACITAAARLMLALLERRVTDLGGSYAFCDTDSMAIVSTKSGGLIPCPGGADQTTDGRQAIYALSWDQVEKVRRDFAALNPYDERVPGSILELEDENFEDRARNRRRQLHCFAISAKRYALYAIGRDGDILLRGARKEDPFPGEKWSEHGLGHLLNPTDPESEDRDWIRQLWEHEIRRELRLPALDPPWLDRRALGRMTVSKYRSRDAFNAFNEHKRYADQIKPFNFMLTAHGAAFGHAEDAEPEHFQLIAPWEPDARNWPDVEWVNRDQPEDRYRAIVGRRPLAGEVQIKTYRDVLGDYRVHPESKSLAPDSRRSGWHSRGLLRRRPVIATRIHFIGKESNELEDAEAGLIHDQAEREAEYQDPGQNEWELCRSVLARLPRDVLITQSTVDPGLLSRYISGKTRPRNERGAQLLMIAAEWAREQLETLGQTPPRNPLDRILALRQLEDAEPAQASLGSRSAAPER